MEDETILALATGRKHLLKQVLNTLEGNLHSSSISQHLLIRGPRGMGKSFFLKYLQVHFNRSEKFKDAEFILLPEEQNNIHSPSDLIRLVLNQLKGGSIAETTCYWEEPENIWRIELQNLKSYLEQKKAENKNYLLVIVIENLDELLKSIKTDKQTRNVYESRFRHLLEKIKNFTIIGATPSIDTHAIDGDYNSRLFHAFKKCTLKQWSEEDYFRYFERRKTVQVEESGITYSSEQNALMRAKLKALCLYTGGSPRMAVVLSNLLLEDDVISTSKTLFGLIDDLTPYYQDLTKNIPKKSKILFDTLIRKGENLSQSEIAEIVGATQSKISKAFLWLKDNGYIIGQKRSNSPAFSYRVSDRIYVLYYQLREIHHNQRISSIWLLSDFLVAFYQEKELRTHAKRYLRDQPSREANDLAKVYLLASGFGEKDELPDWEDSEKWISIVEETPPQYGKIHILFGEIEAFLKREEDEEVFLEEFKKKVLELVSILEKIERKETLEKLLEQGEVLVVRFYRDKPFYQSSIFLLENFLQFRIKKPKNISKQAWILKRIGWNLSRLQKYDKAIHTHLRVLMLEEYTKDINGYIWSLEQIGWNSIQLKEYDQAIKYLFEVLELRIKANKISGQTWNLEGLGLCFSNLDKYEKSIEFYRKALILREKELDINRQAWNLERIGISLQKLDKYEEAIEHHKNALKLRAKGKNTWKQAWNLDLIAWNLTKGRRYKEAIEYHQRAQKLRAEEKNSDIQIWNLSHIVVNHIMIDEWKKVKELLKPNFEKNNIFFREFGDAVFFTEKHKDSIQAFSVGTHLFTILKERESWMNVPLNLSKLFANWIQMKISLPLFQDLCEEALSIFPEKNTQIIIQAALHTLNYVKREKDPAYLEKLDPDMAIALQAIVEEAKL